MDITGTLVNYYIHCKRQCYLFGHKINLEDNQELVKIGKVLHEEKLKNNPHSEISLDSVRIDSLDEEYLVEVKKSDADVEAAKWQLYYYLYILKKHGINRRGKLEFFEKKKGASTIYLDLTPEIEEELQKIIVEINDLLKQKKPPIEKCKISTCKKCAYYFYCYL